MYQQKNNLVLLVLMALIAQTALSQSDGFPVVNIPIPGAGHGQKLLRDNDENIYVIIQGYEEYLIDTPDVLGATLFINIAKYDNKGKLMWTRQNIELDYPYENSPDFISKGPEPRHVILKDSLVYIIGEIRGTRPVALFVHTRTLEGEPVDTTYIRLEEGFSVSAVDFFVGNETYILVDLIASTFPSFIIINFYKKKGNQYDLVKSYSQEDNYWGVLMFSFSDNEFYTSTGSYSPDGKSHIYKHNIDGEIIDHFEDDAFASQYYVVEDTVFFYYKDYNVFHNDRFTGDKKHYDDYVPPMPPQIQSPTILDFIRGKDGSIMAVGTDYWGPGFDFSFMHRIAPDGNSEYAWIYDPEVVPLNALWGIVEIENGYVIAGTLYEREYGYYLALIDKEGYLVSTEDQPFSDTRIQVLLYPNPCLDELFIEIEDIHEGRIHIIDIQGRTVHQQQVTDSKTTIRTGQLSAGVYIMRWQSAKDHAWVSKKFVKME